MNIGKRTKYSEEGDIWFVTKHESVRELTIVSTGWSPVVFVDCKCNSMTPKRGREMRLIEKRSGIICNRLNRPFCNSITVWFSSHGESSSDPTLLQLDIEFIR